MADDKTHYLPFCNALKDTLCARTSGYVTSMPWDVTCGRCRQVILAGWRALDAGRRPPIERKRVHWTAGRQALRAGRAAERVEIP